MEREALVGEIASAGEAELEGKLQEHSFGTEGKIMAALEKRPKGVTELQGKNNAGQQGSRFQLILH